MRCSVTLIPPCQGFVCEPRSKPNGAYHSATTRLGSGMSMRPNSMHRDMRTRFLKTYGKYVLALRAIKRYTLSPADHEGRSAQSYLLLLVIQCRATGKLWLGWNQCVMAKPKDKKNLAPWLRPVCPNQQTLKPPSSALPCYYPLSLLIEYLELDCLFSFFLFLAFLTDTRG